MRKLTLVLVVCVLICWHLYLRHSLGAVFLKLSSAERWLSEDEPEALPTRAAWTYRRKQLGVRLLRTPVEQLCVPLASADTPGAFAFGLRLMAIDGTLEDVTIPPPMPRYFGRLSEGQTQQSLPATALRLPGRSRHPCHCQSHRRSLPGLRSLPGTRLAACPPTGYARADRSRLSSRASLLEAIRARGAECWVGCPKASLLTKSRCCPMAAT